MIKNNYNYQDFFLYLKGLKWNTFEKLIELKDFVILNDFFPKSKYHFLIISKEQTVNNLLQVNAKDHLQMFIQKQEIAKDLITNLIHLDNKYIDFDLKIQYPYKKFTISKQGIQVYGISQFFIDKYELSEQNMIDNNFIKFDDISQPIQLFHYNENTLNKLGNTVCNTEQLIIHQSSNTFDQQIGINHNNSLYLKQQNNQSVFSQPLQNLIFHKGYHKHPSLKLLHLHVISNDFQSTGLKRPHHWLAFNDLQFFMPIDTVIDYLVNNIQILIDMNILKNAYEKKALECPLCGKCYERQLQQLKVHYKDCLSYKMNNIMLATKQSLQ